MQRRRGRRAAQTIVRYGAATILLLGLAAGVRQIAFSSTPPAQYITASAVLADIEQTVLASGTLVPFELVNVGAQVSGQVKSLHVQLGDKVAKGQPIATIDSLPQENALRNAEAAVAQYRAQLAAQKAALRQNEVALERQAAILAAKLGSQSDYDSAEAATDAARANVAALEAQIAAANVAVDTARVNLGYTKITSPIDGDVIAVLVKQGQTVNAVHTVPTIVKVARLDTMTVKAQISEADVIRLEPGQKVHFTILGDSAHRYHATLRAIEPAPESFASDTANAAGSGSGNNQTAAVYYNALFDVANPDRKLRTSMTAQVNIVVAEARQAVTVSSNALNGDDETLPVADDPSTATGSAAATWARVRVVDDAGQAQARRVRVGINNGINAQILEGLSPGARVVVSDAADAAAASRGQPSPRR